MRILRDPDLDERTGLSAEHRRKLELNGLFPQRFKLVPGTGRNGAVGWLESEIVSWIEARAADREHAVAA